ncbi:MAG: hypothetical protein L0177_06685, partial [Chloroflexi bacterium]|nr:hypothetical protein [Chloroflexota bacterium]
GGVYKKLLFSPDGTRLLGGVLVGDAADYGTYSILAKTAGALPCKPHELLDAVREAQASGEISTREEALEMVGNSLESGGGGA